jgi:YVTN family beta-propeller protein
VVTHVSAPVFARPHDLALGPRGRLLFVADLGNDRVSVLDPQTLEVLGSIGDGELASPHDVAFTPDGRLLVADSGNDRVAIYVLEGHGGRLEDEVRGELGSPEGVTAGEGDTIFVTSVGHHTVSGFTGHRRVLHSGRAGRAEGEFLRPHDIELGPDARLYVADPGNHRVQVLDTQLRVLEALGGPAFGFNEPKYLALDARGWLYVADQHNDRLVILNDRRRHVAIIDGASGVHMNRPEGVEVQDDIIWVADTYNNRILRLTWR